jgi:hypothetical protein
MTTFTAWVTETFTFCKNGYTVAMAFATKIIEIQWLPLTKIGFLMGNVCFLIVYHYETNAILALPIKGFGNDIIFATYKQQCNMLEAKGYKIKLTIMDDQVPKTIKKN